MNMTKSKNKVDQLKKDEMIFIAVRKILKELSYEDNQIEDLIKSNEMINTIIKKTIISDIKISFPYSDVPTFFDLGNEFKDFNQDSITIYFDSCINIKELRVVYRNDLKKQDAIIILNDDLKLYDFIIKNDDINDNIKKKATKTIKDNLLKLSSYFECHTTVLMNMIDDILYCENDYFKIQKENINLISNGSVNGFKLMTTTIYTGITNQITPKKYKSMFQHTTHNENCVISFDNQQNITNVEFKIIRKSISMRDIEIITVNLNGDLNIVNCKWISSIQDKEYKECFNYSDIPLEDALEILSLKFNKNKEIIELIPELSIESAYDFSRDDFKDRLMIAKMLLE